MSDEARNTVYIETSVVSYLTATPSRDLVAAAWQRATTEWWETERRLFELCTAELTWQEAERGNPDAAARRLEALAHIRVLPTTEAATSLAVALVRDGALPAGADNDALHIGVAAAHGVDFLLTWNFRHLANAVTRPGVRAVCARHGLISPEICTPNELMGD